VDSDRCAAGLSAARPVIMGRLFWKFFFFFILAQLATTAFALEFWMRHGRHTPRPPLDVVGGGVLASLSVAILLAWYVSKPIRSLRQAFNAAAHGDLDARIGDSVGRRRDELADLGRDFDRTAAHLKLLMDGQRRLLHDVSHELRSPLARLQVSVGLARQHPGNVPAALDRVERESVRMDKLVDELLTLSRLESGMVRGQEESVDVAELVAEVVADATFELKAQSKAVGFDIHLESLHAAKVTGNAEMLHRALENVVRNSVRHTPSARQVHVLGEYDAARHEVRLMIADEGPGVAAAELDSIFKPFFRGEGAQGTPGHGLGLAITHKVIESHGGRIRVFNRTPAGLAVEIRLPA
jgi:two-component system OmpR family sensor kinase